MASASRRHTARTWPTVACVCAKPIPSSDLIFGSGSESWHSALPAPHTCLGLYPNRTCHWRLQNSRLSSLSLLPWTLSFSSDMTPKPCLHQHAQLCFPRFQGKRHWPDPHLLPPGLLQKYHRRQGILFSSWKVEHHDTHTPGATLSPPFPLHNGLSRHQTELTGACFHAGTLSFLILGLKSMWEPSRFPP